MWLLALLLVADSTEIRNIPVAPAETVHVAVHGTGTPVVFIPGLFGAAFGFRRVVPPLTDVGYQTIVFEPLGIGHSGRPRDADYSLTAQAHRLAAVLDTLGVRGAILVPHAMGASIALRLAVERPEQVAALVLLDGGPAERAGSDGLRRALRWAPLLKFFGAHDVLRGKVRTFLHDASGDDGWVTEDVITGYTAGAAEDLGKTLDALRRMVDTEEPWRLRPRLTELRAPVTLVLGTIEHDGGITDEEVRLLESVLPRFVVDRLPGVGHFAVEERPDLVVEIIESTRQIVAAGPEPMVVADPGGLP